MKPTVIYEEKSVLTAKFNHPRCKEYVHYSSTIKIRGGGKHPVEASLKFDDIPPDMAPMPAKEHSVKASSIVGLYSKLQRWFRKFGYTLQ